MPPLIKNARRESTDETSDVQAMSQEKVSREDDGHNSSISVCAAPHPMDRIVWRNVAIMGYLHALGVYGIYLACFVAQWKTLITAFVLYIMGGLGITAGAHRLWSHRSYKARFPLRLILMIFNCIAFENDIYEWSRDHRVHHKFSETDADPHNAVRGFFFSHIGWLLSKKHPLVTLKGKSIDCSDILADPVVRFQKRHYLKLVAVFAFIIPTSIPYFGWNEPLYTSFVLCGALKYLVILHATWLVNSAAHMWGNKPYDKHISPSENRFVTIGAVGEGFHNYHHTFPWDYAASEYGIKWNVTTLFIDSMARIGWAFDRKVVSSQMIQQRKNRTGDGSDVAKNSRSNRTSKSVDADNIQMHNE